MGLKTFADNAFISAITQYYVKSLTFSGLSSRPECWLAVLYVVTVGYGSAAILSSIGEAAPFIPFHSFPTWLFETWILLSIFPLLPLFIRRFRDAGEPWWRIFTILIPWVGILVLCYFLSKPTSIQIYKI